MSFHGLLIYLYHCIIFIHTHSQHSLFKNLPVEYILAALSFGRLWIQLLYTFTWKSFYDHIFKNKLSKYLKCLFWLYDKTIFGFVGNGQTLFQNVSIPSFPLPYQLLIFSVFRVLVTLNSYVVVSDFCFNFQIPNDTIQRTSFCIIIFILLCWSVSSYLILIIMLFAFLFSDFKNYFCIFNIWPLSDICFANISSILWLAFPFPQ